MSEDLTENDLAIRQINCGRIIDRIVRKTLQGQLPETNFYQ